MSLASNDPPTPPHRAKELERRAADLEQRLSSSPSSSDRDEGTNALRVQVCELLADVLLLDPSWAAHRKVPDRLWRTCFYGRISGLRSRLTKEQHRRSRGQHKSGSSSTSPASTIAALEQHLAIFLGEAITLYDYLCQRLWDRLRSEPSGGDSAATVECLHRLSVCLGDLHRYSSNSSSSSHSSRATRSAETVYLRAARLGPGYGHPPNQLGVLCGAQVLAAAAAAAAHSGGGGPLPPNPSALGLYWYARALLATREPFETARTNLARLFQANDDWLRATTSQNAGAEAGAPPSPPPATRFLAQFVQLHGYLFRLGRADSEGKPPLSDSSEFDRLLDAVLDGFQSLLRQSALGDGLLVKLVCVQAFSECYDPPSPGAKQPPSVALIGGGSGPEQPSPLGPASSPKTAANRLARLATLSMGCHLADRVIAAWEQRASGAGAAPSPAPSARLLLPLALLSKYTWSSSRSFYAGGSTDDVGESSGSVARRTALLAHEFWYKVARLLNLLLESQLPSAAGAAPAPPPPLLPEHAELRGFSPFRMFLPDDTADGFASPTDALQVGADDDKCEASAAAATQESSSSNASSSLGRRAGPSRTEASSSHNRSRVVAHLLAVGRELVVQSDAASGAGVRGLPGRFVVSESGQFAFEPLLLVDEDASDVVRPGSQTGDTEDDDSGGDNVNMAYDDESLFTGDRADGPVSSHVLMYQENKSGGPALLVPGVILQPAALSLTPGPTAALRMDLGPTPMAGNSPFASTGLGLPEAGTQTTAPAYMEGTRAPTDAKLGTDNSFPSYLDSRMLRTEEAPAPTAAAALLPPPGFGPTPPTDGSAAPFRLGTVPDYGPTNPGPGKPQNINILESMTRYGAPSLFLHPTMATANPFASVHHTEALTLRPPLHNPAMPLSLQQESLWMSDAMMGMGSDGTSLLDSGLLHSLLHDDGPPKTENPFAA